MQAASSTRPLQLKGLFERVQECNTGQGRRSEFVPLNVGSAIGVGYVRPDIAQRLAERGKAFYQEGSTLRMADSLVDATPATRTDAVHSDLLALHADGLVPGWRNEMFPVVTHFNQDPLFSVERAAALLLGIKAYGIHCNGLVQSDDGRLFLWVATRSSEKSQFPSMLDHLCAGGQPQGISPKENVVKECQEEANVPPELARRAIPTGAVSYEAIYNGGLKRDVLFTFDLHLPQSFQPENIDGEVASFELKDAEEVLDIVSNSQKYKPNCSLVLLDFFFRHGYISPEMEGYLSLYTSLRSGDCS